MSISYTTNLNLAKPDKGTLDWDTYVNGNADILDTRLGKTPYSTTGNITYYVRTDGSNTNDGSANDSTHAFLTIQHAIDMIPQIVNHTVTINVAQGTYDEACTISGFFGKGTINIYGDTTASTSFNVQRFVVVRNSLPIVLRGFNSTSTLPSFGVSHCINVNYSYCNSVVSTSNAGFSILNSIVKIDHCNVSNRGYGILSDNSRVFSDTNSGTSNTVGLRSQNAATIGKNSTQPSGTTAEETYGGGVIR